MQKPKNFVKPAPWYARLGDAVLAIFGFGNGRLRRDYYEAMFPYPDGRSDRANLAGDWAIVAGDLNKAADRQRAILVERGLMEA